MSDLAAEIAESLLALVMAVRAQQHYPPGHPAVQQAVRLAHTRLARLSAESDLLVAALAGELVVNGRPMPGLSQRVPGLLEALAVYGIECLVFAKKLEESDVASLAGWLSRAQEPERHRGVSREQMAASMRTVLLRLMDLPDAGGAAAACPDGLDFQAQTAALLSGVGRSIARGPGVIPAAEVRGLAEEMVAATEAGAYRLIWRSYLPGWRDLASHTANVALMSAAIALEAGLDRGIRQEIVAAALLHDVGRFYLPATIRTVPAPLLDRKAERQANLHPWLGARLLLQEGCPALWVAVALDHHVGVDERGYPAPRAGSSPHAATRIVTIANYLERKRTTLQEPFVGPEPTLRSAFELAGRYLDPEWLAIAVRALGVFPPGTTVELTSGQTALVVRANPTHPLRPKVRLLSGEAASRTIDLRDADTREGLFAQSIVQAIAPLPEPAGAEVAPAVSVQGL